MNKEDIIYKDGEYTIIKKDAGIIGSFQPIDMFNIINICARGLDEWENGGCKFVGDYEDIINGLCDGLRKTIKN